MSVLLDCAAISTNPAKFSVEGILTKRLLLLVLRTVYKTPEIEYVHYVLQIVNQALKVSELRKVICSEDLRVGAEIGTSDLTGPVTYHLFLKNTVEKQAEVVSIDKLFKKVVR